MEAVGIRWVTAGGGGALNRCPASSSVRPAAVPLPPLPPPPGPPTVEMLPPLRISLRSEPLATALIGAVASKLRPTLPTLLPTLLWTPLLLPSPDAEGDSAMLPPPACSSGHCACAAPPGGGALGASPLCPALLFPPTHPATPRPSPKHPERIDRWTGEQVHGDRCQTLRQAGRGGAGGGFLVVFPRRLDSLCG